MNRDLVFISYSHKDRLYFNQAQAHLQALESLGKLEFWTDERIEAGALWQSEIAAALARARVALLLVSSDYLASDFIRNNELPHLLGAAAEGGVKIIWVPIAASMYKESAIAKFQAAWSPEKPLSNLRLPERKKAWVEICQKILAAFHSLGRPAHLTSQEDPPLEGQPDLSTDELEESLVPIANQFEYEEAMEKVRQVLRCFAPNFEQKFNISLTSVTDELAAENAFRLSTVRAIVFGQVRVGKTTTINRLLEANVFPTTGALTCTRSLAAAQHKDGLIFYDTPGIGDEVREENIARIALDLDTLPEDSPLDTVRLLDLTTAKDEGPNNFRILAWREFESEILGEAKVNLQGKIVGKEFSLESFRAWKSSNPFAFAVFVVNSVKGVTASDSRLIAEFCRKQAASGLKIFFVFNVYEGKYQPAPDDLPSEVRNVLYQASQRLERAGVQQALQWILIDSHRGLGIEQFVKSFADNLPVEVLRNLSLVIKKDYSGLITARLVKYFYDYLGLVASLVAVFPADHSVGSQRFLVGVLESLVDIAEFLAPGKSFKQARAAVGSVIGQVEARSLRGIYDKEKIYKSDSLPAPFSAILRPAAEYFELYEEVSTRTGEQFGVGGINSIRVILPLGLAIARVIQGEEPAFRSDEVSDLRDIEERINACRNEITAMTKLAGKGEHSSRVQLAEKLYEVLRPILE